MPGGFGSKLGQSRLGQLKLGDVGGAAQPQDLDVPFIDSTLVLYAPTLVGTVDVPFIASTLTLYDPELVEPYIFPPFIGSTLVLYDPELFPVDVRPPFIASTLQLFAPTLTGDDVQVPFIASTLVLYPPDQLYTSITGPGNGGEIFGVALAPTGVTVTAHLAAGITAGATAVTLVDDDDLPSSGQYVITVDDEQLLITRTSPGVYRIVQRPLANTTAASHAAGADATWNDTYLMAVESTNQIGNTVEFEGDTFDAWLIAFDSSQAYLAGDRYATHVDELVGVFPPGTGTTGTNKLDGAQPSAEHAPAGVTDDCPVGITVPARVIDTIDEGDVALARYTNTEAGILTLGPRSTSIQSWYGFMRVDAANTDVTASDPDGTVVDGHVHDEFFGDPFVTVTLDGDDRTFTHGGSPSPPNFDDKGWPLAALAIRQGIRRVPLWTSPDWHDFQYVYSGFGTDATFVQVLINRNGFLTPSSPIALPGPQDIDGPNATWDDETYYTSTAWYVGIFKARVLLAGPPVNPPPPGVPHVPPPPATTTIIPSVPPGPPGDTVNDPVDSEGGSGGDIDPPPPPGEGERFWVALVG